MLNLAMRRHSNFGPLAAFVVALCLQAPVQAQDAPPSVRATVNGEAITSDVVEARQYDLIAKDTIVEAVLTESRMLSRSPAVAQDLKSLLTAVVQENPDASREQVMAIVQEKSVAYTQVLAVRKVKPKLFAEVEAAALDQLIDEQLKLQEAKRQNISVDDAEVEKAANGVGKRAGADGEPLHKLLVAWDKRALPSAKARIKAETAWQQAITARFGAEASKDFDAISKRELAALKQAAQIERKGP